MSDNEITDFNDDVLPTANEITFDELELNPISSTSKPENNSIDEDDLLSLSAPIPAFLLDAEDVSEDVAAETESETVEEVDPIFAALARPALPELQRENRARLQMQSPNKLFFYWSIKNNPFQTLSKILNGGQSSYQLVAKFVNQKNGYEQIVPVEAEGNYWFNAESDAQYQAEIGFYAVNRPYFRIMFSNHVETPRKTPSPRQAAESDWAISAAQFAEVLDNSGFTRDAFEVALAGDDEENAKVATHNAFSQLLEAQNLTLLHFNEEEIRFALLVLASGVSLDDLRGHISDALFEVLQANSEKLTAANSLASLEENFEITTGEIYEEEFTGAAVYGLSLINFPKTIRQRTVPKTLVPKNAAENAPQNPATKYLSKLSPVSSFR